MEGAAPDPAALRAAYRAELAEKRITRHVRVGTLVAFGLQTAFVLLDWLVYPAHFGFFFGVRMALNVVLAVIYFWASRKHPVASEMALCLAVGTGMLALIYGAGALTSPYYAGLILVFFAMGVIVPLTAGQSAWICGVLFMGYAAAPLFVAGPVDWSVFGIHCVFLAAGGVVSVVSSGFLDQSRLRDFAQRREIEAARDELAQLDVEKSRFTANVHHELRTPLTLMMAPIEAMLGGEFGDVSELQRGYLRSMQTNALRLLNLINNLLDLAKIEGAQLSVARRPTRIADLVTPLISGARPLAERKGVELVASGLETLPEVNVDPEAIDKVLVNLVGNALKFTQSGRIEVRGEPTGDGGVHVVVSDTGIGLPEDQLARIFDRFAQVDASSTRRHEGTGIGLSLAKELIDLHGGRIWAESRGTNRGTQMHLVLPPGEPDVEAEDVLRDDAWDSLTLGRSVAAMEGELDAEERHKDDLRLSEMRRSIERREFDSKAVSAQDPGLTPPPDAPEIVICEDNADMRRLLGFLVGQEFRVRLARNGREGLDFVRESAPDLVLTDVMMPEMSGTELCKILKDDPETAGIPIMLITSKAEREMKIRGLELGADDYVAKPFHPRELMARVRALSKLRRLQQEVSVRAALLESANAELGAALGELQEAGVRLAQAERLAAVGELAAGVAHEINNPMNFATNALDTLRRYVSDIRQVAEQVAAIDWQDRRALELRVREVQKLEKELEFDEISDSLSELIDIVSEGLDRTQRMVGDLRDLAAPGDGQAREVDLARGLRTTAQLVSHAFREADVRLCTELPDQLPVVRGDPRALNQVFLNLLKNAAEAIQGGGGTVWLRAHAGEDSVVVEIRDDGTGIAPADLERIFEPFFSTKSAGRGTGLGLSISSRIVVEHGGRIDVRSQLEEGTTFVVQLPFAEDARAA